MKKYFLNKHTISLMSDNPRPQIINMFIMISICLVQQSCFILLLIHYKNKTYKSKSRIIDLAATLTVWKLEIESRK